MGEQVCGRLIEALLRDPEVPEELLLRHGKRKVEFPREGLARDAKPRSDLPDRHRTLVRTGHPSPQRDKHADHQQQNRLVDQTADHNIPELP